MTVRRLWSESGACSLRSPRPARRRGVLTAPFLLPYLDLRDLGFSPRGPREVDRFSADVYAYLTADAKSARVGIDRAAWPRAERALFPGITVVALAAVALQRAGARPRFAAWFTAAAIAAKLIVLALLFGWSLRLPRCKITSLGSAVLVVGGAGRAALACSRDARSAARRWLAQPRRDV